MKNGGWLHRVNNDERQQARPKSSAHSPIARCTDFAWFADFYAKSATNARVVALAESLGVSFDALRRLQVGWDGEAYTQPMQFPIGKIVGIQRRFPDGSKLCVPGSKGGFFAPVDLNGEAPLFVAEGYSDLAALLTIGLTGVALFNAGWNPQAVRALASNRPIVLIRDNDSRSLPGHVGGRERTARFIKAIRAAQRGIAVISPPKSIKDLRAWLHAGCTKETLLRMI
jgi:hypothetical protein